MNVLGEPDPWDLVLKQVEQARGDFTTQLARLREDNAAQWAALNARLDKLVTTEVHAADLRRIDDRLADLQAALSMEKAARMDQMSDEKAQRVQQGERKESQIRELKQAIEAEVSARRLDVEKEREDREECIRREKEARQTNLRWVFGTLTIPSAAIIANIILTLNGGG